MRPFDKSPLIPFIYSNTELKHAPNERAHAKVLSGKVSGSSAFRISRTGIIVAVIAGHQTVNFKALAKASGNKKTAMVKVKDINALTGYIRGGCSPIGMKKRFPVFLDESAKDWPEILINAGTRGLLFGADPQVLAESLQFRWAKVGQKKHDAGAAH